MTIALAIKVHDGIVLASDSASTVMHDNFSIANIYNNSNKIVNLDKRLPIGLMTWGLGNIGQQSIATLAKDLRMRFMGKNPEYPEWKIDREAYDLGEVAELTKTFFHDELLSQQVNIDQGLAPELGVLVAGFSAVDSSARMYSIHTNGLACEGPLPEVDGVSGATWFGQPEAITRLLLGFSTDTENALIRLGVSDEDAPRYVEELKSQVSTSFIQPPMPIQDAVDFAEFLVDTTIKYTKYSPGYNTVGGPIELAAITRHEGFKWVKRKLYYPAALNV